MRLKIIKNVIRCNHCGDVIESIHRHDFKTCRCGRVAIDGGHDYLSRAFTVPNDYTDLSVVEQADQNKGGFHS